jgi:riboflavin kinase/FMN adenylyltransferase
MNRNLEILINKVKENIEWHKSQMGKKDDNFDFVGVDELILNGDVVSSTGIRRRIASGQLAEVREMLGRHYSLTGIVGKGHQDAAKDLNSPTANLDIQYGVLPPTGVYAGRAFVKGKSYVAAVNIGISPTYNRSEKEKVRLEAHLLGFSGNLYGQVMEVELLEYLREERCFLSPLELKEQIKIDLGQIKKIVKK